MTGSTRSARRAGTTCAARATAESAAAAPPSIAGSDALTSNSSARMDCRATSAAATPTPRPAATVVAPLPSTSRRMSAGPAPAPSGRRPRACAARRCTTRRRRGPPRPQQRQRGESAQHAHHESPLGHGLPRQLLHRRDLVNRHGRVHLAEHRADLRRKRGRRRHGCGQRGCGLRRRRRSLANRQDQIGVGRLCLRQIHLQRRGRGEAAVPNVARDADDRPPRTSQRVADANAAPNWIFPGPQRFRGRCRNHDHGQTAGPVGVGDEAALESAGCRARGSSPA